MKTLNKLIFSSALGIFCVVALAQVQSKLGYLKGTIKQFDGAGCSYILQSDDKKKGDQKSVGVDSYDYSGLVINIDGNDVLFKGKYDDQGKGIFTGKSADYQVLIPSGKAKSCGEECSKTMTSIIFTNSSGSKTSIPVVSYCGS